MTRAGVALHLERSMEERLGRCRRCMALSAVLVAVSWALAALVARTESGVPALVVLVTAFTALASVLGFVHAVAYFGRRGAGERATTEAPGARRGGCGCGGGS